MNFKKELVDRLMELHGVKNRACARHLLHQRRPHLEACPYCETLAKVLAAHPEYEQVRVPS
jgi:hypothetical protein